MGSLALGSLGSVVGRLRVSPKRAAQEGLSKIIIRPKMGQISGERWGQNISKQKAEGPSYRHDPRRAVSVCNTLKHPQLHSLIDTVTHLKVGDMRDG